MTARQPQHLPTAITAAPRGKGRRAPGDSQHFEARGGKASEAQPGRARSFGGERARALGLRCGGRARAVLERRDHARRFTWRARVLVDVVCGRVARRKGLAGNRCLGVRQ